MDLSVVIPSYKSEVILKNVLDAIFLQDTNLDYEVILVDSSPNSSTESIVSQYENIIFSKQKNRTSASSARNIGADLSKSDLILFIDSDVTVEKDCIEKVYEKYKQGSKIFTCALELDNFKGFSLMSFLEFSFFFSESFEFNPNRVRKNLPSTFLAIDRNLFVQMGKFIEYGRIEDTYLTEKIRKTGVKLNFYPDIKAKFYQEVNFIQFLNKCRFNGINVCYLRFEQTATVINRILIVVKMIFISIIKFFVMAYRNIFYRREIKEILCFIAILPFIFLGNLFWFFGALEMATFNRGIDQRR